MTVKDKGTLVRKEYEFSITLAAAAGLLAMCPDRIDKIRYIVPIQGKKWEIDVFRGKHRGLTVAELELKSVDEQFEVPQWIGKDITEDRRYSNASLSEMTEKEISELIKEER